MNKKVLVVFVSILFVAGLIACGGGKAKKDSGKKKNPNRGRATGYATIFDNDTALARDRASDDAKNKLVSKILGETVSGTSLMKNYEMVSTIVQTKSSGLVKNIEVIKQGKEGNEYIVTIEGTVEPAAVADAIADALERYGRPKFMVLIKETFDGKRNMPGFTETEMIMQEIMGNSGFEFVDAAMTQQLLRREKRKMQNAMAGRVDEDTQQLLLNDAGAEVIIIGTAQTKDQSAALRSYGAKNMKSKSAIIRIKAIDVYTGKILATISRNAPGLHIESDTASKKAIENAMKIILGKTDRSTGKFKPGPFINTIVKKFVKAATNREINVRITGLDYNGLKEFRNQISNRVRGVQKVLDKGRIGKASKLEVYFAGKTTDFLDELKAKSEKMGFNITIKENFPNKAVLDIKQIK